MNRKVIKQWTPRMLVVATLMATGAAAERGTANGACAMTINQ